MLVRRSADNSEVSLAKFREGADLVGWAGGDRDLLLAVQHEPRPPGSTNGRPRAVEQVSPPGIESPAAISESESSLRDPGSSTGAESGAVAETDAELASIIAAWPRLSKSIRRTVGLIVHSESMKVD